MRILAFSDWKGSKVGDQVTRLGYGLRTAVRLGRAQTILELADSGSGALSLSVGSFAGEVDQTAVVAVGRIDNLSELRSTLDSDHEEGSGDILIKAYLAWGDHFPARVVGDFALVLWDGRRRRLLAVRDAFGVTPLVYRTSTEGVWVASGVEQILRTFDSCPDVDDQMVVEYLLGRFRSVDATFFRQIRQVPAGHVMIAESSGSKIERYWHPPTRESLPTKWSQRKECYDELKRLFVQSVERRLQPDGSVVIHVSGGLDSSSVAVAADSLVRAGRSRSRLHGAAGRFVGLSCDEETFIEAVAHHVGFPVQQWDATISELSDLLNPTLDCPGGRITNVGGSEGDLEIARRIGAKAILTGVGGDQLGTCTGVVHSLAVRREWTKAARELLFFPEATAALQLRRLLDFADQVAPTFVRRWIAQARSSVPSWLRGDFRGMAREIDVNESAAYEFSLPIHRRTWGRLSSPYTMRTLESMQRQAASKGLEYRFPFLDGDLVRFILGFPFKFWPRSAPFARLHREALEGLLPPSVARRMGKAEFTPAFRHRTLAASEILESMFSGSEWASTRYVDQGEAQKAWRTAAEFPGLVSPSGWRELWAVATLEAWLRKVLRYHWGRDGKISSD